MTALFDLYTNKWEYDNPLTDRFGRARLFGAKGMDIFSPAVAREVHAGGFRPHYPGGKKFSVCLSHDIDHLYLLQGTGRKLINAGKGFMKGRLVEGLTHLSSVTKEKVYKEYDLRKLIGINNSLDIRSSYYFLSLEKGEEDFNYDPSQIGEQLRAVIDNGNEIGLHGGHKAYNDPAKLAQEKRKLEDALGSKVTGYRNHYLRMELPATLNYLEQLSFEYDTTLGYADCAGFRNGMCYPFYPYDPVRQKFLDIVELPLIIMDATLFFYMRLDFDVAFTICKQLTAAIKECGGVLTLLWHNNFISGDMGAFYRHLLEYLRSEDPWFATSSEVIHWWKAEGLLEQSHDAIKKLVVK